MGVQTRQRAPGTLQFIGHLDHKKMLTEKTMHVCLLQTLRAEGEAPPQAEVDCLAKLMSMVGQQLEANPRLRNT